VDPQDASFLLNTGLAHKRVRVVQLLVLGIVGLLLGWLGNFFVGSSCHFVSSRIVVGNNYYNGGGNNGEFALHFGLWKYSSTDSALTGYKYCVPYTGKYAPPIVSRAMNASALVTGTYSLAVLWTYLILGKYARVYWKAAVYSAVVAGVLQLCTLYFFVDSLCRDRNCELGPASIVAFVTAVAWLVFGLELHYNTPNNEFAVAEVAVSHLEMSDFEGASVEYMERVGFPTSRPQVSYYPPTLPGIS
jgi:hypothetical protein